MTNNGMGFAIRGIENASLISAMVDAGRQVIALRRDMREAGRDLPPWVAPQYDAVQMFVTAMEKVIADLVIKYRGNGVQRAAEPQAAPAVAAKGKLPCECSFCRAIPRRPAETAGPGLGTGPAETAGPENRAAELVDAILSMLLGKQAPKATDEKFPGGI